MSRNSAYLAAGAVVLIVGGLAAVLATRTPQSATVATPVAISRTFAVEGMHCEGCAESIEAALAEMPGVRSAKVSFGEKRAVVVADEPEVPADKIVAAIAAAGYKAQLADGAIP
jgi:copper chaperone CopZ